MSDLIGRLQESIADAAAYGTCAVVPLPELRWAVDEITRLREENVRLREDAARYQWLRRRIKLTNEEMMSGTVKLCLTVRMAFSCTDRTDDPACGYLSQDRFAAECAALDDAIDAAMREAK